jgi:alpha-beta hydrolase superfamily lysophospholipase
MPVRSPVIAAGALAAAVLAAAAAASPAAAAATRAAGPFALTCSAHVLPVAITDPGPADQSMWGELCYRGAAEPSTVQLLVPGATYTSQYWNLPYGDGYYSYVAAATAAGYATFDVDRIGDGNSSHPPSAEVTIAAGAVALHDAVTALRSGAVAGHAFANVIMVGHSLGAFETWAEDAAYHDVDAVIITGALHQLSPVAGANAAVDLYPAVEDPKFASSGLDPGYLTSKPGTRETLFYDPATTSPAVVAIDEAAKATLTTPELGGLIGMLGEPAAQQPSSQVNVPVLIVAGAEDNVFCAAVTAYQCTSPASVRAYESQFYAAAPRLAVVTIPKTGHDLALSTTAPLTDAVMLAWSAATIAP